MSAVGTIIDAKEPAEIEEIVSGIEDPVGLFYRFSIPASILRKKTF
jgi:hypothetical protein